MSIVSRVPFRRFRLKIGHLGLMALAVGMGAAAASFSGMPALAQGLSLEHRSRQLYFLRVPEGQPDGASSSSSDTTSFSLPVFEALRGDQRAFSAVMAYAPLGNDKVVVEKDGVSEKATGEMVSGNFFSGLGVKMRLGGRFKLEDERRHTPVVVLSFAYWTHLYSRDPDIAGRTIYIQGVPFAVLGVTAEGFSGVEPGRPTDFWIPLQRRPELNPWGSTQMLDNSPNWWCLRLIARLAPGVDAQRAVAEATPGFQAAAYAGLGAPSPEHPKVTFALVPATGIEGVNGGYRKWMLILMAAAILALLMGCGYVAMRMRTGPRTGRGASV